LAFGRYFVELPFNDSYLFGLIHLISVNYFHAFGYKDICKQNNDIDRRDVILGFAAVFLFIKSYASCLVAELSQLCYKGVLRAIALASTDGLCTFSCSFLISLQPVIVPVGRIALGRILNVVGSSIDRYLDLALSSQFQCSANNSISNSISTVRQNNSRCWFSSCSDTSYPLTYPNHLIKPDNRRFIEHFNKTSLCLGKPWCIYIAYFYGQLQLNNWILFLSAIVASRIKFVNFNVVCSELIKLLVLIFYNSDTLYSLIKPIHKTPLAIIKLSVSVKLFETGIKVVDLLTPYKSGGKIELFGGAGVGKTVLNYRCG